MFLNKERRDDIQDIIDGLLFRTGLEFPKHSIMDMCDSLGVQYTLGKLKPNESGVVFKDEKGILIVVNENDPPVRQHFTLAHELGHIVLGHVTNSGQPILRDTNFIYTENTPERQQESEANYFAAVLLVPIDKLEWAMEKTRGDIGLVAKYFGVSTAVISNRLREQRTEVC